MVLENLTLGALDAQSLNAAAQEDALNPLGGFNVPNLATTETEAVGALEAETQTPAGPGDPPTKSKGGGASKESLDLYNKQKQLLTNWSNTAATVAQTKRDPRLAAGRYEYDQFVTNVDRYRGYGKSTFNKLGFNPLEDNEKYYNQNTNWYQDFRRMGSHFFSLFGSSFVDNSTPYGAYNLFSSDEMEEAGIVDLQASENQAKHMRLGASQRGGITEFTNNLLLNSAYSFGIIANVAAEELAIAGATALTAPETAGGSLLAGGAATAKNLSKLGRIGKAWKEGMALSQTAALGRMALSGGKMLTSLNKVDAAKSFWQAAKGFGNSFVDFANPLRGTTSAVRGMTAATGAAAHLTSAAKLSKGFGAFYRDMREFNFTLQEARLEAGGVYDRFVNEQLDKIRSEGREPSDEELKEIYNYAQTAAEMHGWTEIPIIFATNRIVFDGLFKFKGVRNLTEAAEAAERSAARGIGFDVASKTFAELPKAGMFKQIGRTIRNPRLYGGTFLNYTKANLAEGVQEITQETSADSIVKYYSDLYNNPENGNADYITGSLFSAIGDQIFSKQGVETFLSGFLMGGVMNASTKAATNVLTSAGEAYMKVKNPEKYNQYIQNKLNVKKDLINSMNQIISDPESFFSPARESFVTQKRANDNMVAADMSGDNKAFIDAKDEKTFDHVFTALNRGTFNMVIDGMKEMGKLNEQELAEAFGLPEGSKAKDKVQEYIKRAEQIKSRYDYFQSNTPNPFKPGKFKKGSAEHVQEFISFKAFEDARKAAVASQYGFDRALERMNSITGELSEDRPISRSAASDMTVLLNEKTLRDEIKLLKQEIKSSGAETAEQKAIIKDKTKKLEALEEYQKSLKEYKSKRGTTKITESGQIELFQDYDSEQSLRKSYENYLKYIAKANNDYVFDDKISSSFKKIMDFYELDQDAVAYNDIVNKLLNPEEFRRHYDRLYNSLNDLYNNREEIVESSIDKFLSVNELNALMVALGQIGVIINPDEIQSLVENGVMPSTFLDMRSNQVISKGDPRYDAIVEMMESFRDIQGKAAAEQEEPSEEKEEVTPAATQSQPVSSVDLGLTQELQIKLEDAYNNYRDQTGSDITFEEYVNSDSPTVRAIKAQFGVTDSVTSPEDNTEPTDTSIIPNQEAAPVSDIEDKKADIEKKLKIAELIEKARSGDKDAQQKLKTYGLSYEKKPVYRYVSQREVDALNNGERIQGKFKDGRVDVTTNPNPSTGADAEYRITFNDTFDFNKGDKARLKNEELGDGWISEGGYTKDDILRIEKRNDDGTYTTVYEGTNKTVEEELKAELDALEGAKPAVVTESAPAEKTGTQKAQELIDSVSSIRDLFDMNSDTAIELINDGVSSVELRKMLQTKREELVSKISTNDLQKFDIVTLTDGSKVAYVFTKNGKVHVKTPNDAKGEYTIMDESDFLGKIQNVEPAKTVSMIPTETAPPPQVTEQDKNIVASSRDTMDSFVNDAARLKSVFDNIMNQEDSGSNAEDDLLNNLGCDT